MAATTSHLLRRFQILSRGRVSVKIDQIHDITFVMRTQGKEVIITILHEAIVSSYYDGAMVEEGSVSCIVREVDVDGEGEDTEIVNEVNNTTHVLKDSDSSTHDFDRFGSS
ncbi:hypothetical protein P8452_16963 [Trifolium repens]|nr:hypothetical protein P8452_16963 [Trifolium repens]